MIIAGEQRELQANGHQLTEVSASRASPAVANPSKLCNEMSVAFCEQPNLRFEQRFEEQKQNFTRDFDTRFLPATAELAQKVQTVTYLIFSSSREASERYVSQSR